MNENLQKEWNPIDHAAYADAAATWEITHKAQMAEAGLHVQTVSEGIAILLQAFNERKTGRNAAMSKITHCYECGMIGVDLPEYTECGNCNSSNIIKYEDGEGYWPIRDALAAYAHDAWSGWMKYEFSKSAINDDGTVIIPAWAVERWTRQMNTPFLELPDKEKASDYTEANKMLLIVKTTPK